MRTTSFAFGFHGRLLVVAAFGLALAPPVRAHQFCVGNSSELQGALTAASAGGAYNGESNAIDLVQGTYLTPAGGFHYYSTAVYDVFLTGGYTDALCTYALRASKPLLVKLDGHGATGVLSISNANGYVGVKTLTIQNGDAGLGAGLQINYLATPNNVVSVADVVIRNNHSNADAGGLYATAGGNGMFLNNTLIVNNSADQLFGGAYVTSYSDISFVVNNTVARNTSGAAGNPVGGLYVGGSTQWAVYKNILWNNTGLGLYIGNGTTSLLDNDYGNIGGMAPQGNQGAISVNPAFVDAANGNFRLDGNSPLLGYSTFPGDSGYDLDGNTPPVGGGIDLGAYYETIFVDGLEATH